MDVGLALWLLLWTCLLACAVLIALLILGIVMGGWWLIRVTVSALVPARWKQART